MPITQYTGQFIRADDQTVSTTTLTSDNILTFQMDPTKTYKVYLFVPFVVNGGLLPAYSWTLTGPTGTSFVLVQNSLMLLGASVLNFTTNNAFNVTNTSAALTAGYGILEINALIRTTESFGNFNFKFGCAGGSTSVTNLASAYLRYDYALIS